MEKQRKGREKREVVFYLTESDGSCLVDIQIISGQGHPKEEGQRGSE